MNTAPAPNTMPIPGMCPGVAVKGGGGGAGGSGGDGSGDGSGGGGGGNGNGNGANPDQKGAGSGGEPVDVITGRVYTLPVTDLALPGPLPFAFRRVYSSSLAGRDIGLGPGWTCSLGFRVEERRRGVRVHNDQGIFADFDELRAPGDSAIGPFGWVLRREPWGYALDVDDGVWRIFAERAPSGKEYLLTTIQDRAQNRISLTYEDGRLAGVTDSAGREIRFAGDGGRITSIEVKNAVAQGRWVTFARFTYDGAGDLVRATDADGHAWTYAYDDAHRLVRHTNRTGLSFHYVYDAESRGIETWGELPEGDRSLADGVPDTLADGETRARGIFHCKIEYGPNGYREVTDSRTTTRYWGNAHGLVDKSVGSGSVIESRYDKQGFLLREVDAVGAVYTYDRDPRGRITRAIDPLGRVNMVERDAAGLPVRGTDAAGNVLEISREARGLAETVRAPDGAVTRHFYDERGLHREIHDPLGGVRRFVRDAHDNVVQRIEPDGATWLFAYDHFGRLIRTTAPTGATVAYRYSERGDVIAKILPDGGLVQFRYDGEGHVVERIDPARNSVRYTWGGYHVLCARTDENGSTVQLAYDRESDLVAVANERGEAHRFERDTSGRIRVERTFDGRTLRYKHDAMGRLVRIEAEGGALTEMELNLAGELVRLTTLDGAVERFAYDARGLLSSVESEGVRLAFERDPVGRIVRETQQALGETFAVDVQYDLSGRRVGRHTSRGHTAELTRDASGKVANLTLDRAMTFVFARDGLGRETTRLLPGGGRVDSAFDVAGRLVRRTVSRPAAGEHVGLGEPDRVGGMSAPISTDVLYRYDVVGDLTESWDKDQGRRRFEHDPAGRLLAVLLDDGTGERFSFDSTDNLREAGASAVPRVYEAGSRLVRRGDTAYDWDANGRLAEKRRERADGTTEVTRYRWNGRGLLESVERPDGTVVSFRYDAFARRIEKGVSQASGDGRRTASVTRFFWDRYVPVHEVTSHGDDPAVEERTYVFEDDSFAPLAQRDGGGDWLSVVNDQNGIPVRLVDGHGDVAGERRAGAWGTTSEERGRARTPLRFQGQHEDEETGLFYNRHRYYDPEIGRYISADPIGLAGGLNLFAYPADPTSEVDPLGEELMTPQPMSDEARQQALANSRADFDNDPHISSLYDKIQKSSGVQANTKKCSTIANEYANSYGGGRPVIISSGDPQAASPLNSYGPDGKPMQWADHYVNHDPNKPGRIIDFDQRRVWDSKQDMVNGMFKEPVNVQTDYW